VSGTAAETPDDIDIDSKILSTLSASGCPMSVRQIQNVVHARTATVLDALHRMRDTRQVTKSKQGWQVFPVSHPGDQRERKRSEQVTLPVE
jgi:hypothetical protein